MFGKPGALRGNYERRGSQLALGWFASGGACSSGNGLTVASCSAQTGHLLSSALHWSIFLFGRGAWNTSSWVDLEADSKAIPVVGVRWLHPLYYPDDVQICG